MVSPADAQFLGFASPQTITQPVFTASTCASHTQNVRNIGQSVHYVLYTTAGTITSLSLQIEASANGTNWFRISDTATSTGSGGISASLYAPLVRVNITACSGTGTITATYSGTSVANGPAVGIFSASSTFNKDLAKGRPANTTATFTLPLTSGGTGGAVYLTFSDNSCAASTLTVQAGTDATHLVTVLVATTLAATADTQVFSIPALPAILAVVTYTTGCAASVATYDMSFAVGDRIVTSSYSSVFFGGGSSPPPLNPFSCNQRAAINISGAGNHEIIAFAFSYPVQIHICHISLSLSGGSAVKIIEGTGTNCAVGAADLTGPYYNTATLALDFASNNSALRTDSENNVCVNLAAGVSAGGVVLYAEF